MDFDVTIDRDKYIGGSDVPAIMGLSSFRTRWQLLLEKAGLETSGFAGSQYTEYGNILEPKIRAYINEMMGASFAPDQIIKGDLRANMDGFGDNCVLEIKTTSNVADSLDGYKHYLVQLLFYMQIAGVEKGLLAVYHRPDDFNTDFEPLRLECYGIRLADHQTLVAEINAEIDRFRADLERLKDNPLLSEQDFQPKELVELSSKLLTFEQQLSGLKALELRCKELKQQLFEAMLKHNVKGWKTPNGVSIARVDAVPAKTETVQTFDVDKFRDKHPKLYARYASEKEKTTSGRSGYVKITLPKGVT